MALTRTECPECGAGLKLPVGFLPGRGVRCPKCETYFVVEETGDEPAPKKAAAAAAGKKPVRAATDEEPAAPKKGKKKRKRAGGDEWSYKTSWVRFAVLGVLLVVLGVLGYMLYDKDQKEKAAAQRELATPTDPEDGDGSPRPKGGEKAKDKDGRPAPAPKTEPSTPLTEETRKKLVGRWEYEVPEKKEVYTVEYKADGSFAYTADRAGGKKEISGKWALDSVRRVATDPKRPPSDKDPVGFNVKWAVGAGPAPSPQYCMLHPDGPLDQPLLDQIPPGAKPNTKVPSGLFVRK